MLIHIGRGIPPLLHYTRVQCSPFSVKRAPHPVAATADHSGTAEETGAMQKHLLPKHIIGSLSCFCLAQVTLQLQEEGGGTSSILKSSFIGNPLITRTWHVHASSSEIKQMRFAYLCLIIASSNEARVLDFWLDFWRAAYTCQILYFNGFPIRLLFMCWKRSNLLLCSASWSQT